MFEIGFLPVSFWDILDILIVGILIYQIYKLLRGSVALNIFVGVIFLFILWWLVGALNMDLLSSILGQFVSVGVIVLIIIFQPEARKFLLLLGNNTLKQRSNMLGRILDSSGSTRMNKEAQVSIQQIKNALNSFKKTKTGALIVITEQDELPSISDTGVKLDASISSQLLESIFSKESPLHDGAVTIANNRVVAAGCVLPLSSNIDTSLNLGMRHRAGLGASEQILGDVFIVSEESGNLSHAKSGKLHNSISEKDMNQILNKIFLISET